jgi:hypothetical protein
MRRLVVRIGGGGRARVQHAHPTPGGPSRTVPARRLRVTQGPIGRTPYRGTDRQVCVAPPAVVKL